MHHKFLKGLQIARHNAITQQIANLLKSNSHTWHYTLTNANCNLERPQDHIIPSWLLPCTCLARLCQDIMHIHGATQEQDGPFLHALNLAIQIIEYTFTHDKFIDQAIRTKQNKYNPLISAIEEQGWIVNPLIIITVGKYSLLENIFWVDFYECFKFFMLARCFQAHLLVVIARLFPFPLRIPLHTKHRNIWKTYT